MAKKVTSKKIASKASSLLRKRSTGKKTRAVAASALSQREKSARKKTKK